MKYFNIESILILIFCSLIYVHCVSLNIDAFQKTIYNNETILIKQEYVGPRFKVLEEGRGVTFQCVDMFKHVLSTDEYKSWESKGMGTLVWPPPKAIPNELLSSYSVDDKIPIVHMYFEEKQNGGSGYNWTKIALDEMGSKKCTCGGYARGQCQETFEKYGKDFIHHKRGAVIGSQTPWAEAALLAQNAKHITTIEYMQIESDHPHLSYKHPDGIRKAFLAGEFKPFDFVFSFSSLEHDGLGRYGDPVNPFGDLESIARVHCLLKPDGIFFLSFPINHDTLVWNAHRVYGKVRLALVLMNWEVLDIIYDSQDGEPRLMDKSTIGSFQNQPILVLKKKMLQ